MQISSQKFRPVQFFICEIFEEMIYAIFFCVLYGDVTLVSKQIQILTNSTALHHKTKSPYYFSAALLLHESKN